LAQLEYAVSLADHGHFGRAAAACGVSQPALSMQLRTLERQLGITLFDRSTSPIKPTDVGALVIEQARTMLGDGAALVDLPSRITGRIEGELTLGVLPTLAPYLLPRALPVLARKHPALRLVVEELPTPVVLERLRNGAIDAGLIATIPHVEGVRHRALFREPLLLYVHARHPLAGRKRVRPDELAPEDAWLLSDEHCLRSQSLALCRDRSGATGASCVSTVRFESGNVETLRRLVEGGEGFTLLPWLAVPRPAPRNVRVIPIGPPSPSREVRLVQRRQFLKAHLIEAVLQALLADLPSECARA
jgi:LysR family transcriptional regulator, hydrogen peroxide-inducible genes activator